MHVLTSFDSKVVTVDAPFNPPPSEHSIIQVGQFRGQLIILGNAFLKGGGMQLYAACYDCVVAENEFREFGFSNWGRNPHGTGWQPNLNNVMADNKMTNPNVNEAVMGVRGCSLSCSDSQGQHCTRPEVDGRWIACAQNQTSIFGRDCAPFSANTSSIGSYRGAVNLQLAWRRNEMSSLLFFGAGPTKPADIATVDSGVVEHTIWLPRDANHTTPRVNLSGTTNILLRD